MHWLWFKSLYCLRNLCHSFNCRLLCFSCCSCFFFLSPSPVCFFKYSLLPGISLCPRLPHYTPDFASYSKNTSTHSIAILFFWYPYRVHQLNSRYCLQANNFKQVALVNSLLPGISPCPRLTHYTPDFASYSTIRLSIRLRSFWIDTNLPSIPKNFKFSTSILPFFTVLFTGKVQFGG
jgi:hypothetical protein